MDYLLKAVDNRVVDSPPSRGVSLVVNSPSPLQRKDKLKSSELNLRDNNGA